MDDKSRPRLTKERILEAARHHFARFGFRKASLTEIAKDLGVVKGALYYYIPGGKQELFDLVVGQDQARIMAAMRQAIEAEPDPRRKLCAMVAAKIRVAREIKDLLGLHREVMEEIARLIQEHHESYLREERELIEQVLAEGEARGIFRPIRPMPPMAAALQAALRTLTVPEMFADAPNQSGLLEPLCELLLKGIENR